MTDITIEGHDQPESRRRDGISLIIVFCIAAMVGWTACSDDTIVQTPSPVGPDTSSHEWIWTPIIIDELDAHGHLRDICYINDTCIWAVGYIGAGPDYFNGLRWNGKKWVMEQIIDSIPESSMPSIKDLQVVYGSEPDNVWFGSGRLFTKWDGSNVRTDLGGLWKNMKGSVKECWASGPNNIWMGGVNGELVHYDGRRWRRIQNEIEWDISAIHGSGDTLLIAATGPSRTGRTAFYHVIGESVRFWRQDSLPQGVQALWYDHLNDIYTDGARSYKWDGRQWVNLRVPYAGYGFDMAANNRNDILICGDICTIRHWNGKDWRSWWKFPGIESARFWGVAIHGDEAWVVGSLDQGARPIIMHGQRRR